MKTQVSKYRIAISNGAFARAQFSDPQDWVQSVSVRQSRAMKAARKLQKEGNKNVVLFMIVEDGKMIPISTRPTKLEQQFVGHAGTMQMGQPLFAEQSRSITQSQPSRFAATADLVDGYRALTLANSLRTR
jgi:hypothetical protein